MLTCEVVCLSRVHRIKHTWRTCYTYKQGFPTHHPSSEFELGRRQRATRFSQKKVRGFGGEYWRDAIWGKKSEERAGGFV